jgi:hypothetical protein
MTVSSIRRFLLVFSAAVALAGAISSADAAILIPTNLGVGADAEVRDHQGTTNFGAGTELATRILNATPPATNEGADRFSAMYLRFDISDANVTLADLNSNAYTALRLTYRNNNWTQGRVEQTANSVLKKAGLQLYALDMNHAGNNWDEATITFNTAPGMLPQDGLNGIQDYDTSPGNLILLGTQDFTTVTPQNRQPVGGTLEFASPALRQFLINAKTAGKTAVTLVAGTSHDGDPAYNNLTNFNYLFNPKEQLTINTDAGYDADTTDPNNPLGAPFSGASNANGRFSPTLFIHTVPEPGTLALVGMGWLVVLAWIRRRT